MLIWPKKSSVKAKLAGQTLIAVFRASNPPLIWQFDLEKNHSFTVALQGEEGDFELGVTSPKGEFYPIARFADHEEAEDAFMSVQKALLSCRRRPLRWGRIAAFFILVAIALYLIFSFSAMRGMRMGSLSSLHGAAVEMPSGVPLPADEVLRPPQ